MSRSERRQRALLRRIERRRRDLEVAREELRVLREQSVSFVDEADEAQVRSVVSESRHDERVSEEAARHLEVMRRSERSAVERIERLDAEIRELIEQVTLPEIGPDSLLP